MAAVKTTNVVRNNITMTAGAGNATSDSVNISAGFGAVSYIKLTNGSPAPTVAAQAQIQLSPNDTDWYDFGGPLIGNLTVNGVEQFITDIPVAANFIRFITGSNTVENVTMRIEVTDVASVI